MKPEKNQNKKPLVWDYTFCVFYSALLTTLILVLMYQLSNEAHIKILKSTDNPISLQMSDHIPQPFEILKKTNISLESYNNELLAKIFNQQQYRSLYDQMNKAENSILTVSEGKQKSKGKSEQKNLEDKTKKKGKSESKVILSYGQQLSVAKQFIKHYAANEEYYLVERQITGHLTDQVYRTAWTIRNFINQKMGIIPQSQKQKVLYVLYTHSRKDVEDTLDQLLQSDEIDKIIIVAAQKIKIRKFKNLGEFPRDSILEKISSLLKITPLQVSGYINYYGVDGFFDNVKVDEASPKQHLKESYLKLPKNASKQKKIHNLLKSLCKQKFDPSIKNIVGKQLRILKKQLEKVGVVFENRTLYWANDLYRLNYMVQTGSLCQESQLDAEAKYRGMQLMEKIILQNEKKIKQEAENQQKKRLELMIEERAKQLAQQQQHQCPQCSCSLDIEKQCKKIFKEMNKAQSEVPTQIKILNKKKKANDKIRIGLKGFQGLLNQQTQSIDGELNLEEIQAAIKNPSGKIQETLEETFNKKQEQNGEMRDDDEVTSAKGQTDQSEEHSENLEGESTESAINEDTTPEQIPNQDVMSEDSVNEENIDQDAVNQEDIISEENVKENAVNQEGVNVDVIKEETVKEQGENSFILKQNNDDIQKIEENSVQQVEEGMKQDSETHQRSRDDQTESTDQAQSIQNQQQPQQQSSIPSSQQSQQPLSTDQQWSLNDL